MTQLEAMLRLHEGEKLLPYKCTAGKLTIGVGRNLEARGISKDESDLMLRNDIALCVSDMQTFDWFSKLNRHKIRLASRRFLQDRDGHQSEAA